MADFYDGGSLLNAGEENAIDNYVVNGIKEKNKIEGGTLYLVATPIGNMADLSDRAKKVLSEVDFIAAEDTRVAASLLAKLGISRRIVSHHEHNSRESGARIAEALKRGESCALVSDAGTPAINDPGEALVKLCAAEGIKVTAVPGACAAVTALVLSGLDTSRFMYEGFLERQTREREKQLERIRVSEVTVILYEAPHRLAETLEILLAALGDRRTALCRELTKLNEEIIRGTISEALAMCREKPPRGEYVLVIEGGGQAGAECAFWFEMTVREHYRYYSETLGYSKNDAIKAVARDRGLPKNTVYKEMV